LCENLPFSGWRVKAAVQLAVKEKRCEKRVWRKEALMPRILGHCLCRAVTFEIEGDVTQRYHCHCESCRRATSSPFTSYLSASKAGFRWTGATPGVYRSSPGVNRSFCTNCGSPMAYESDERPEIIDVFAASLADPTDFNPEFHDFWSEKLPWISIEDGLPRRD
jgi:hypothetical protein